MPVHGTHQRRQELHVSDGSGSTRVSGSGPESGSNRGDSGSETVRPGGWGAGPTRVGATGTGVDGLVAGGALLLALYGLVVIAVDLVSNKKLLPDNALAVAGIIIGFLVVGAIIGGVLASRSDR
jgi:hypothetical protein